jgi:glycosyltransferase involved in cell wall biosynthesis
MGKAVKILYSHRTKSADGQYVHIRSLTDALRAQGAEIFMAGPDDRGQAATRKLDQNAGVGAKSFLPKPVYELAELAYSAPAFLRLARAAKAARPDILYERYNLFYHSGVRLARVRKLPFLLEVNAPLAEERARHGGLAFNGLARWSEGEIWRAADKVLPVTRVLARKIEARGVPPEKIEVIANGVEAEFLTDVDPRPVRARYGLEGKLVLGFTGFVRDWHGVDRVIRYLARSRRDDLHLLVVGDGDVRPALLAEAQSLGVAGQVTFTGIVQREEVAGHVAAFDIALQPAVVDYASPLKLMEYMALARATIAPSRENIREVLGEGEGLLVAPDDEAALCEGLDALVSDSGLREKLGAAARAGVLRRNLTWAGNAERVLSLAEGLLNART